jgi:hypothetical protein
MKRGKAKVTLLKAYFVSLPCDRSEHALFVHGCFFDLVFCFACNGWQIKFCVKLVKSTAKTLEMLCEVIGEHSSSQTAVFEWHSHFKAVQVSVEDGECSG